MEGLVTQVAATVAGISQRFQRSCSMDALSVLHLRQTAFLSATSPRICQSPPTCLPGFALKPLLRSDSQFNIENASAPKKRVLLPATRFFRFAIVISRYFAKFELRLR
jgi:hypothetical protein